MRKSTMLAMLNSSRERERGYDYRDSRYREDNRPVEDRYHDDRRYPAEPYYSPAMRYYPPDAGRYEPTIPMDTIGFNRASERDYAPRRAYGTEPPRSMAKHMTASMRGEKLDHGTAMTWVKEMKNSDGTKGAHWDLNQTDALLKSKGWNIDNIEFYTALNMMYSDFYGVAKKLGINSTDFYAEMAKAWLEDKDAGAENKLTAYYYGVVCGE